MFSFAGPQYNKMKPRARKIIRRSARRGGIRQATPAEDITRFINTANQEINAIRQTIEQGKEKRAYYYQTVKLDIEKNIRERQELDRELANKFNCFDEETEESRMKVTHLRMEYISLIKNVKEYCVEMIQYLQDASMHANQHIAGVSGYVKRKKEEGLDYTNYLQRRHDILNDFFISVASQAQPVVCVAVFYTRQAEPPTPDAFTSTQQKLMELDSETLTEPQTRVLEEFQTHYQQLNEYIMGERKEWENLHMDLDAISSSCQPSRTNYRD